MIEKANVVSVSLGTGEEDLNGQVKHNSLPDGDEPKVVKLSRVKSKQDKESELANVEMLENESVEYYRKLARLTREYTSFGKNKTRKIR